MTTPATGRAAVVTAYNKPLQLREFPISSPEPRAVLVRVETATLCGTDVHLWEGAYPTFPLPLTPGHEAVGSIVAFGDGPRHDSVGTPLAVGDRIVWEHEACGNCYECTVLKSGNLCRNRRMGMMVSVEQPPHLNGTLGEYTYVWPRSGRLRVPDAVENAWASAGSCALRTVLSALTRLGATGGVDYRHNVVVQGSGPLGLFATAALSTMSPRQLIVIGDPARRLDVARDYGADRTISISEYPDRAARENAVLEATDGRGADIVCDFAGGKGVFGEGIELVAPNGRYLMVGSTFGPPQPALASAIVNRNLTVLGSMSAEIGAYYHAMRFLDRHRDRFDWNLMFSGRTYALDEVTTALQRMQSFEEVKAVIEPHRAAP